LENVLIIEILGNEIIDWKNVKGGFSFRETRFIFKERVEICGDKDDEEDEEEEGEYRLHDHFGR
jgi:hypothetical protein